jgi:hypothetical protein
MIAIAALTRVKLVWIIAIFILATSVHAWYYVTSILALPDISEGYARSWDYQLAMFAVFRLPLWLMMFVLVLLARVRMSLNTSSK